MFYVANKSRESETGAYYSLYAFVCHFVFQSATNNTISSNILQYIAICNISIFSIGHIVLYCSSEYCNIAIFQYIVSSLVCMYVCMLYVCMYALKIACYMLFRYLDHCYQLLSSMISMMPSVSLLKGVPTYVCSANTLLIHTGE